MWFLQEVYRSSGSFESCRGSSICTSGSRVDVVVKQNPVPLGFSRHNALGEVEVQQQTFAVMPGDGTSLPLRRIVLGMLEIFSNSELNWIARRRFEIQQDPSSRTIVDEFV